MGIGILQQIHDHKNTQQLLKSIWMHLCGQAIVNKCEIHESNQSETITIARRLKMELLRWKSRMAVLWIIQAIAFAAVLLFALTEPEATRQGLHTQSTIFVVSVIFFIACIMAWFCFTLKESVNRWLSFVLGILFAAAKLISMSGALSSDAVPAAYRFHELWGFLAALLIVWYAWKWPKQEA
jgi:hypothetical protein